MKPLWAVAVVALIGAAGAGAVTAAYVVLPRDEEVGFGDSDAQAVSQADFVVTATVDAVDAAPGDGACATAVGECSLRAAVQEANGLAGAQLVEVPAGTYVLTIAGQGEDAAASGDLDLTSELSLSGTGAGQTVLEANGHDRVLHVMGGAVVELGGLTVRGGQGTEGGGGILNQGSLRLAQTVIDSNSAFAGGGISNIGTLFVQASAITANRAETGGGIESKGGELTLNSSVVSRNRAFAGAGVRAEDTTVTVVETAIEFNIADTNGGLVVASGKLEMTNSAVSSNESTDTSFGDIGGIGIANSVATIRNSTISGNRTARRAGGIWSAGGSEPSNVTILNSTVSGNIADDEGGGILNFSGSTMVLNNVTIANNSGLGGGIHHSGESLALGNTLVAGNIDPSGSAPDCSGTFSSLGYNLIQQVSGCRFQATATDQTGLPAGEGPLADNGGSTQTHALLAGSPAIDAGSPAAPGSGGLACEAVDQRGVARPLGNACDIGAFESAFAASPTPVVTPAPVEGLPRTGDPGNDVGGPLPVGSCRGNGHRNRLALPRLRAYAAMRA